MEEGREKRGREGVCRMRGRKLYRNELTVQRRKDMEKERQKSEKRAGRKDALTFSRFCTLSMFFF